MPVTSTVGIRWIVEEIDGLGPRLQIDDVTAEYAKPLVPELWTVFDANGSMHGDYDCDRPGQAPVRIPFRGIWGRPLPDLQVGYLQPPGSARTARA